MAHGVLFNINKIIMDQLIEFSNQEHIVYGRYIIMVFVYIFLSLFMHFINVLNKKNED